jgi:hypothetical protein
MWRVRPELIGNEVLGAENQKLTPIRLENYVECQGLLKKQEAGDVSPPFPHVNQLHMG